MRFASYGFSLIVIVMTTVASGLWNGRWGLSNELQEAVGRLAAVPEQFGDWESRATVDLDERAVALGEIDGYLSRQYKNMRDGGEVTILLVCGRPGPISLHTPDVCYRGQGYVPVDEPSIQHVENVPGTRAPSFKTAVFRKERSALQDSLIIYWSWNADGPWETPKDPRLAYASGRALYKLYVIRRVASGDGSDEANAVEGFIREFVPELQRVLAANVRTSGESPPEPSDAASGDDA